MGLFWYFKILGLNMLNYPYGRSGVLTLRKNGQSVLFKLDSDIQSNLGTKLYPISGFMSRPTRIGIIDIDPAESGLLMSFSHNQTGITFAVFDAFIRVELCGLNVMLWLEEFQNVIKMLYHAQENAEYKLQCKIYH